MVNTTIIEERGRELAHREGDGLAVTLYWRKRDGRVSVVVRDDRVGDELAIDVAPTDALDAFAHPFAYAYLTDRGALEVAHA